MEFIKTNNNYNATFTSLKHFKDLDNCDNVKAAIIFGNQVIISKDLKEDTKGLYFPIETQLSDDFIKNNNLYRKKENNINIEKSGYFEDNRRIRAVKFRKNVSEGFFIPLNSLEYINPDINKYFQDGLEFNDINYNGKLFKICKKYYIRRKDYNLDKTKSKKKIKQKDLLIENQFKFHIDTLQLKKNIHLLNLNNYISISYKFHGTSFIVSNCLIKKSKLSLKEKIAKFFKIDIKDYEYKSLGSSRKVIKNLLENDNQNNYYKFDIWSDICKKVDGLIPKNFTIYGEAIGFLPDNTYIQKNYDYGIKSNQYEIYIYKVTHTDYDGKSVVLSWKQMEAFCKERQLKVVPLIYYGTIKDWFKQNKLEINDDWKDVFIDYLTKCELYGMNNIDCIYCKNKVPSEGIVIRVEDDYKFDLVTLKLKNYRFLENETKLLDKGEVDIESI